MKRNLLLSFLVMVFAVVNVAAQTPMLKHLSTYHSNIFDEGAAEIVVYDADNNQIYTTNANDNSITILDFSDPSNLKKVKDVDCTPYGDGVNSVTYYNGYFAVACQGDEADVNGTIVFFDKDGNYAAAVQAGFLPDMVTFTPDGQKVIVACEGEPSDDYSVDPEGSVTVIDVSGGISNISQADVTNITFESLEGNIPAGVRVFGPTKVWTDDFQNTDDSLDFYFVYSDNRYPLIHETFENTEDSLNAHEVVSYASNKDWIYKEYRGDHYAEVNGYGADAASQDLLVVGPFDGTNFDTVEFSFYSAKNFSGDGLSVVISNDYDGQGDPLSGGTWVDITDSFLISSGGYDDTWSGYANITNYVGSETYIAFVYVTTGTGGGDGSVYQIDDILVEGITEGPDEGIEWSYGDFRDDYFAEANAFRTDAPAHTALIVLAPAIPDYYNDAHIAFSTSSNYSGGGFKVWLWNWTTDDVTDITYQVELSEGGFNEVRDTIDITNLREDSIALVFEYWGMAGAGNSMGWQIDDIDVFTTELSVAANLEPEYITVSDDSQLAYAFCQENNAVIVISLVDNSIQGILPLGTKDHDATGNGLDASNKDDKINIANWPVNGMYLPDAAAYKSINGSGYLLTANEGDAREYIYEGVSESECYRRGGYDYDDGECLAYIDETRVEDLDLDETAFPDAANLQLEENLGRLKVTTEWGDTDGDGDYDELYSYGARSFTIWDATNASIVFDSGDEFEQWAAKYYPEGFNATNDENGYDDRSDDKGPEPEAITTGDFQDSVYAFIGFERMGGIIVYNITDPANSRPIQYLNNRDFSETVDIESEDAGDLGPECIVYITDDNANKDYIVVANEVSGSVSVYEFYVDPVSVEIKSATKEWAVYPNPVTNNIIRSTKVDDYNVYDLSGRIVKSVINTQVIDLSDLQSGSYLVKDSAGNGKMVLKY